MGEIKKGNLTPAFFFGPLTRALAGIGTRPEVGVWNDIREDDEWDEDRDVAQAGQAVGAINSIVPAAYLVKTMMDELVSGL